MKLTAILTSRNDGYGENLNERATVCLNSLVDTFDEVVYVDWNGYPQYTPTLPEALNIEKTGKLKIITVPQDFVKQNVPADAQKVCEVMGRNIAFRRCTGDIIVSTNIDIIVPSRNMLDEYIDSKAKSICDTMYIVSRRTAYIARILELSDINSIYKNLPKIRETLNTEIPPRYYPGKIHPADVFSIINCCGDFQLAHKNIWHTIKGFEEWMIYACFTDTNVQKKAWEFGFNLHADYDLPVYHIDHAIAGGGSALGTNNQMACVNDHVKAISSKKTSNTDNWGYPNIKFEETII